MTKIEELITSIKQKTTHYADQDFYDNDIENILKEYAEYYAKKCLNTAANNAQIISRTFYEGEDLAYDQMLDKKDGVRLVGGDRITYGVTVFDIDTTSIVNIALPEHD